MPGWCSSSPPWCRSAWSGRRSPASLHRARPFGVDAEGLDPDELERQAAAAERAGDLAHAVRLRFVAGVLRLDRAGVIAYRSSLTTGQLRAALRSGSFAEIASAFDEITYGGRPAATVRRRTGHGRLAARPGRGPAVIDAWRAMRPGARAVVAVLVVVLGLNLLTAGVSTVTGGSGPGGPTSSSYATASDGLAAYAELLARHGHAVERLRTSLAEAALDPGAHPRPRRPG